MVKTERLRELFDYLPSGELVRKLPASTNAHAGDIAGYVRGDGRSFVSVDGKKYRTHRLIWLWHGRELPKRLDHINRKEQDNRIENLRACTNAENGWNAKLSKVNKSGIKGVSWNPLNSKWRVRVRVNGSNLNFGCHEDLELAELVSIEARAKYHGAFANAH